MERITISPAREYILPKERFEGEDARLPLETSEFEIPLLHNQPANILDYVPRGALVLIDDLQSVREAVEEVEEQAVGMRREAIAENKLPQDFPLPYITWSEIADTLPKGPHLILGASSDPDELPASPLPISFIAGPRFGGQLKPFIDYLVAREEAGEKTVIVSRQASRLEELWKDRTYPSSFAPDNAPQIVQGCLSEGWILSLPDTRSVHLLTDGEIFGWRRPEPRKRQRHVVRRRDVARAPVSAAADWDHADAACMRFG